MITQIFGAYVVELLCSFKSTLISTTPKQKVKNLWFHCYEMAAFTKVERI